MDQGGTARIGGINLDPENTLKRRNSGNQETSMPFVREHCGKGRVDANF